MKMYEPRRLHPLAAIFNVLKILKEIIVPFILFILLGRTGDDFDFSSYIISIVILLFVTVSGILSWLRFTYYVKDGELRIEYGIFVRKKRYIPFERIQSLDFSESPLHRLFHLVRVNVETAGSSDIDRAEAMLTAIKKEEALEIQRLLRDVKRSEGIDDENGDLLKQEEIIYQISNEELLLLASTSGGIGVVLSAVVALFLQLDDVIPYERVFKEFEVFMSYGIMFVSIVLFIGFVIAYVLSVIYMMIKYAHFTLKKVNDDLVITRGLWEKREITIPLKRIQGVHVCENLLRQPFHYATVFIESAGGSLNDDSSSKVMILPIIRRDQMHERLARILPQYRFTNRLHPAPKRALRRYLFRGMLVVFLPIIGCLYFFHMWGMLSLFILPFAFLFCFFKFKDAGWLIEEDQLTLRYRGVIRHTVYMKKSKIQTIEMKESYFQKRKKLATIIAIIKSGVGASGGAVVDLEKDDCVKMFEWYSRSMGGDAAAIKTQEHLRSSILGEDVTLTAKNTDYD